MTYGGISTTSSARRSYPVACCRLGLPDSCACISSAEPLPLTDRDRFLQAVADELGTFPATALGPGSVGRVVREVQRPFLLSQAFRGTMHAGHYGK